MPGAEQRIARRREAERRRLQLPPGLHDPAAASSETAAPRTGPATRITPACASATCPAAAAAPTSPSPFVGSDNAMFPKGAANSIRPAESGAPAAACPMSPAARSPSVPPAESGPAMRSPCR
jgi:hypothetical protein